MRGGRLARRVLVMILVPPAVATGPLSAWDAVQPTVSGRGTVLLTDLGQARVESEGAPGRRLAIRSDERLTAIAEIRDGWIAAGIRELEEGTELVMIRGDAQGFDRYSPPGAGQERPAMRLRPTLLVQQEDLQGLAWLEGPDPYSLSIRAASWEEGEWMDVSLVAPAVRGSQTGLTGVVLTDGTWLLVWSAFDGSDDELLWSRGAGDRWSRPRPVHPSNGVPDVLPAIVALDQGARLAWSRLEAGHYRLVSARFDGTRWGAPGSAGPEGSLDAAFTRRDGRLLLSFRLAWPSAWTVVELHDSGRPRQSVVFVAEVASRPILRTVSEDRVEVEWPASGRRVVRRWERAP